MQGGKELLDPIVGPRDLERPSPSVYCYPPIEPATVNGFYT